MDSQSNTFKNTDLNQRFSTITGWQFNFTDHNSGLIKAKVDALGAKLETQLRDTADAPTTEDSSTLSAFMTFVLKHTDCFTIADFMTCLDIKSRAYKELSTIIYGSSAAKILANDELERVKKELAALKASILANNSPANDQIPLNPINSAQFQSRTRSNSCSSNVTIIPTSSFNKFNSQSNNPPASAPTHLSHVNPTPTSNAKLEEAIEKLTKKVEFQGSHVFTERVRVDTDPPVYKTGALRAFARKQYSRWARKQGLTPPEATLFFCMCFENEIESSHIDKIAMDSFGRPKYDSVIPLVEQIICDLKFSEESQTKIRNRFYEFYAKPPPASLDAEYLRCTELRERGWPQEGSIDQIKAVKQKFGLRLFLPNGLHALVFNHCNSSINWNNALSFFELTAQLRNIQTMYNRKQQSSNGTFSNPTKPTNNATVHMETNNIQADMSENNGQVQNEVLATAVNNVSSVKCRNEKCGKSFVPSNPKYYCCSKECVIIWKEKRYGPKKATKTFNNMPAPAAAYSATNNTSANNNEVSLKEFYITPVHIYLPGCNDIPIVIRNSLFDTGAGVTIMTRKMLKKLKLEHKLIIDPGPPTLGGDTSVMKGRIGYVDIEIAIEDTSGYLTKNFNQRFLVYENLNNDIIVGQGSMKNGIRTFLGIPELKTMLFNPSGRTFKYQMKLLADYYKKTVNNNQFKIGQKEAEKVRVESSAPKFSESERFILNVPLSKVNNTAMEMFSEKISEITTGFLNNIEVFGETASLSDKVFGSSIKDIITTGGLDGTFDECKMSVTGTKTLETNKGPIQVGGQLSDKMCKQFKKYVDKFKGKVFDTTSLGRTKQHCHPELKPGECSKSATPKYMPLNPFMQSEAKVLVQSMVDLGVLEETNEPANSSIFIVQKSSGKWRLICDLRRYNEKIVDYVVHLPSPFELINKICTFKMLSYFDFKDAYFQIPLSEDSLKNHPIVASVSGQQYNYKYLKMAQGLKIATSWFIGILNDIYAKISTWVVNYLDDSVLGSENDEDLHFKKVVEFIEITDEAGLRLSLPKCIFFALNTWAYSVF